MVVDICSLLDLKVNSGLIPDNFNTPPHKNDFLKISYCENNEADAIVPKFSGQPPPMPFAATDTFHATIASWRSLTDPQADAKPVYEISFCIKDSGFQFRPGDTIGVIPKNNRKDVDAILKRLKLTDHADSIYTLEVDAKKKGRIPAHVPTESTIRHVLTHCLDLQCIMKKLFLLALSKYTKDATERKCLEYLCSSEGAEMYDRIVLQKNVSIIDIFEIFTTCEPPVTVLLQHLLRLLPRPYSIANSQVKDGDILKICFSVMTLHRRKGLTTGWLESILLKEKFNSDIVDDIKNLSFDDRVHYSNVAIPIYLRKNMGFVLPSLEKSLLLIGPGTGVAPFIGFLEERMALLDEKPDRTVGDTWLFMGSRSPECSLYKDEIKLYAEKRVLMKVSHSYSRMENSEFQYVQDAINANGRAVVDFIEKGAVVYVCGDLKCMAKRVQETITQCFSEHTGRSAEESKTFVAQMQYDKQYLVDIWS